MTSICIEHDLLFYNKIKWFFELLIKNHHAQINLTDKKSSDTLTVGFTSESDIILSESFYLNLQKHLYDHTINMPDGPFILNETGAIDYISSVFYLVNCIQEYHSPDLDQFDRFKYENSLQKKWNIILENKAYEYIKTFCEIHKIEISKPNLSTIFLSHDIDFFNQGWKREVIWSLENAKFKTMLQILFRRVTGTGVFNNIVEVAGLEKDIGHKSTFFWIPQVGKSIDKIEHADYKISSSKVRSAILDSTELGSCHGLHKSSFPTTIKEELAMLGFKTHINRYHYLKFNLPEGFDNIKKGGIKIDSSLGFAEHFGYRNNYGLPFRPFCLKDDRPYSFIEVPLHIMDTTFIKYMKLNQDQILVSITDWLTQIKDHTLISTLWHNNYLSDYEQRDMKNTYLKILQLLRKNNIVSISPDNLLRRFLH